MCVAGLRRKSHARYRKVKDQGTPDRRADGDLRRVSRDSSLLARRMGRDKTNRLKFKIRHLTDDFRQLLALLSGNVKPDCLLKRKCFKR